MKYFTFLFVLNFLSTANAQEEKRNYRTLDIDLMGVCAQEDEKDDLPDTAPGEKSCSLKSEQFPTLKSLARITSDINKLPTCLEIKKVSDQNLPPIELELEDEDKNPWKVRLHFGFNRTDYRPTDVKIESTLVNTTIKGWEFHERTSGEYYNIPKKLRETKDLQSLFQWIDEPTNTFEIAIENKNNSFFITAFHPKTLATYYEKKDENGNATYTRAGNDAHISLGAEGLGKVPEGMQALEIQNTHLLMNYSVGYGRKFNILDKKSNKIIYTARVDVGAMVGGARSIYIDKESPSWWVENKDNISIQGLTGALGHRLEYRRGRFGAHLEQKYTTTQMSHPFLDGKAEYKLDFSTIQFGVNIDLHNPKKKRK